MAYTRRDYDYEDGQATGGSGCLSGLIIPPVVALVVGLFVTMALSSLVNFSEVPSVQAMSISNEVQTSVQEDLVPAPEAAVVESSSHSSNLAPLFTREVHYWAEDIERWASDAGLDPNLVATVMQIESCGDPKALSSAGAMGLFQVMPFHFSDSDNPYAPDTNARRGTAYLKKSLEKANGNPGLAFAGYNGGIGVIGRAQSTWAAETRRYLVWGSGIFEDADRNSSESETLNRWLNAGGASLCRQASKRLGLDN